MKLGLPVAVSAVALFSGTITWSTFITVQRDVFQLTEASLTSPEPDRREAGRFIFHSGPVTSVDVQAPVVVELDETFTGVELLGDTSAFRYLQVSVGKGPDRILIRQAPTKIVERQNRKHLVYEDSLATKIKSSNIVVKIGIGKGTDKYPYQRNISFSRCKKVVANAPVHGGILLLYLKHVDSVRLNLDVQILQVNQSTFGDSTYRPHLQFSGTVKQAGYSALEFTDLDAEQLHAREVYLKGGLMSSLRIYASEVANLTGVDRSKLHLSGNPTYTKIKEATNSTPPGRKGTGLSR